MSDWWPSLLRHLPAERPWDEELVTVAEIKRPDHHDYNIRTTVTALVPVEHLDAVSKNLAAFGNRVTTTGPNPDFRQEYGPFEPKFWIEWYGNDASLHVEPLVVAWESGSFTVLSPNQGFLMTYGLVPRAVAGATHWDEPTLPRHDIVVVQGVARYEYGLQDGASVRIQRDYLQDYSSLRHCALIQIYFEQRWGSPDKEIEAEFGHHSIREIKYPDRTIWLHRHGGGENLVSCQVEGARILSMPGDAPISKDRHRPKPLTWPGIEGQLTHEHAMRLNMMDSVYVRDSVLGRFEGRPEFKISPEHGSVSRGGQWSVGFCHRMGRDLIRLEPKKLYEGAPNEIIEHWNRFAVAPPPEDQLPQLHAAPNIATRAKALVYGLIEVGESVAALANPVLLTGYGSDDFVGLDRAVLDYNGWWSDTRTEEISRHVPVDVVLDRFLDRCESLDKLISEGLVERNLRTFLLKIGLPAQDIAQLRSLKLFDLAVRMAAISAQTGLGLQSDGKIAYSRIAELKGPDRRPFEAIFVVNDLRILKAHRADRSFQERLTGGLNRLGVDPAATAGGYGLAVDKTYDALIACLDSVTQLLRAAHL